MAASAARALELGGSELMHGKDEDGKSLWAVLVDPNGAAFGIMPVVSAEDIPSIEGADSSDSAGRVGCISWVNLTVAAASATGDFYRQVVGWVVEDVEVEDEGGSYANYKMLCVDGIPAAGICHARGDDLGLPSTWLLHLPVADLGESRRRAEEEGGKVIKAISGSDGKLVYAAIQDPVGAYFALVKG